MKIAIQGHPTRGKEVIQILESLGGRNAHKLCGNAIGYIYHYHIDNTGNIIALSLKHDLHNCKFYTLEEFEKEFPFKIGDLCIYSSDIIGEDIVVKILGMTISDNCIMYEIGNRSIAEKHSYIYRKRETLKPYKEMKEERNITLTLDKAKEWYNKGGELKEIALQAFTEKELIEVELPESWEEFCADYMINDNEAYFDTGGDIFIAAINCRDSQYDKTICPSKKSAEAHLAMIQLEQLRNCWWNGWEPEYNCGTKYIIKWDKDDLIVATSGRIRAFLIFPTREIAEEFLKCFRNLIEKAGDLI